MTDDSGDFLLSHGSDLDERSLRFLCTPCRALLFRKCRSFQGCAQ